MQKLRAIAAFACLAVAAFGCKKGGATTDSAPSAAPAPPKADTGAPATPAPAANEPFAGTYQRTHELVMKNGQRLALDNTKGTASIQVGGGKVVYTQQYPSRGTTAHVTQTYSYTPGDIKTVSGGFDVTLKFVDMQADTKSYNPDKNNPKVEARRTGSTWQIGFTSVDDKGVWGGVEFQ